MWVEFFRLFLFVFVLKSQRIKSEKSNQNLFDCNDSLNFMTFLQHWSRLMENEAIFCSYIIIKKFPVHCKEFLSCETDCVQLDQMTWIKKKKTLNVFNKMVISDANNNNDCSHRSPITIKQTKDRMKKKPTKFRQQPKKGKKEITNEI